MRRDYLFLTVLLLILTASCLHAQTVSKPSIIGAWTIEDTDAKARLVFSKDGTFTRTVTTVKGTQGDKGTWKIAGNIILVEPEGDDEVVAVKFKLLTVDKLKLTIPDEGAIVMDRVIAKKSPDPSDESVKPLVAKQPVAPTLTYKSPDPLLKGDQHLWLLRIHGLCGYVDAGGKVRIEPQFDIASDFVEGRAFVKLNGKYGYIDLTGRMVVEPKYSSVGRFSEGLAWVKIGEKIGFINRDGKVVIAPRFDGAWSFHDGLASVREDGRWGYIDKTGKVVIEAKFETAYLFHEGLAGVEIGNKWGFIDKTGKTVIGPKFDWVDDFSDGLAPARLKEDGDRGYIDKTGKWAVKAEFSRAEPFREGLGRIRKGEKKRYGFVDKTGKLVIPATLIYAGDFSEGLAAAEGAGGYIYIDKSGKAGIKVDGTFVRRFRKGRAVVKIKHLDGLIDRKGKILFDPLAELRSWAALDRVHESTVYGGVFKPILVKSRNMAERYLNSLRDTRKRPLYYRLVTRKTEYGEKQLGYTVVDQDGGTQVLIFQVNKAKAASRPRSPVGLFLLKDAIRTPKPKAAGTGAGLGVKYKCGVCNFEYDPAEGNPKNGVKAHTAYDDLPGDWVCPQCGNSKDDFDPVKD